MPELMIFVFFAVFIAIAVLALRQNFKMRAALTSILPGAAAVQKGKSGGVHNGRPYEYHYFSGSKNSPPYLKLSVDGVSSGEFTVVRETGIDNFFKRVGINKEVQTGDRAFDASYYILSEHPEFASRCFAAAENRAAAAAVLTEGFTQVRHDGKIVQAVWTNFRRPDKTASETIHRVLDSLIQIAGCLPADFPRLTRGVKKERKFKRRAFLAFPWILGAAGVVLSIWGNEVYRPLDRWPLFLNSLAFAVPLLAAFLWVAAQALKGRASSHRDLTWVLFSSVFSFGFFMNGVFTVLNGAQDMSESVSHTQTVSRKYVTRSKNSTTYHVVFSSWREGRREEKMTVSRRVYEKARPNSTQMKIRTREGYLRHEWIESYELTSGDPGVPSGASALAPATEEDAYRSMGVPRVLFSEARFKSDAAEGAFLRGLFEATDRAMMRRMEAMTALLSRRSPENVVDEYEAMKSRIAAMIPPPRLYNVHARILQAMDDQHNFLRQWMRDPESRQIDIQKEPLVLSAQRKLMQAYAELLGLYRDESEENLASFRSHLAALDFI